jgi:hypothetical protein
MTTRVRFLALLFGMSVGVAFGQQKYALVIGITGYPGFPVSERLKFADRDAEEFASFIISGEGGGFPAGNVHLVTNANATRVRLYAEFDWLYRTVGPTDLGNL